MEDIIPLFSSLHLLKKKLTVKLHSIFFLIFIFINNVITKTGKKRAYQLGQILRNRYDSFLGDVFYQPNVYAQSTMIARTKTSLQLVHAGLYPPAEIQIWNPLLPWQPMDFTYTNIEDDNLFFSITCPV